LTPKWKIFRALNYCQFIIAIFFYGLSLNWFFENGSSGTDYLLVLLLTLIFMTFILNSFLNLYIIRKFFPDELMPKKIIRFQNITTFFFTLGILALLIAVIAIASDGLTLKDANRRTLIFFIFLLFIALSSMIIWLFQLQLESLLRKNNFRKIKDMIYSIGREEKNDSTIQ
jgi:uncharacterized membrane protein